MDATNGDEERPAGLPLRPYLRSVDFSGWPGLESVAHLDLSPKRTVLVGRNGAGKSLLLSTLELGAELASWAANFRARRAGRPGVPLSFSCEVRTAKFTVGYSYIRTSDENDDESLPGSAPDGSRTTWSERAWNVDTGEDFWRVEDGALMVPGEARSPMQPGAGLLAIGRTTDLKLPEAGVVLQRVLGFVSLVPAGVPRSDPSRRGEVLITRAGPPGQQRWRVPAAGQTRVHRLAVRLATLWERDNSTFLEFAALARSLGLAKGIGVRVYKDPREDASEEERHDVAVVDFDDTNLGLLSDGTLRVAEILLQLLGGLGSPLLLEEPETAVHPGLLSRLLSVFDSYAVDRQLLISTHSPLVVNWCAPEELRLITRENGRTVSASLTAEQARRVNEYLNDEGTLGEYVFMQSHDE